MQKKHPVRLAVACFAALSLLTGCGGGAERPTVEELSTSLQSDDNVMGMGLEADQADCLAEAFHESDISDETLQAIVDNDADYEGNADDEEAVKSISTDSLAECMAG